MFKKYKNIAVCIVLAVVLFGLSFVCFFKEDGEFSDSERRALASFPEFSLQSVMSGKFMSEFETYSADQFPMRDSFRTLKAVFERNVLWKSDSNNLFVGVDGHMSKIEYPIRQEMLDDAAKSFDFIYESFIKDSGAKPYLCIVPDKNPYVTDNHLMFDYDKFASFMQEKLSYMEYIDIYDLLSKDHFYKTDSHWKQEKIVSVADRILSQMGTLSQRQYTVNTLDNDFYGVYKGQSALPLKPDTIKYLTNDSINNCVVTSYNTGMPVKKSVYDMEKAYDKDPYEMFLGGADALITIENQNAKFDKELIIFRDSYGSSIAPLFIDSYKKITIFDLRYIKDWSTLGFFADFEDADVLFMFSTVILNNFSTMIQNSN